MPERSLWPCLHDAYLIRLATDAPERTVTAWFRIPYLTEHAGLPPRLRFHLVMQDVQNLVVLEGFRHPDAASLGREEAWELGRWESRDWSRFARSLERVPLDVMQADLQTQSGSVTLCLEGVTEDRKGGSRALRVRIEAGAIRAARSDGRPFSLARLEKLGRTYWQAFGQSDASESPER